MKLKVHAVLVDDDGAKTWNINRVYEVVSEQQESVRERLTDFLDNETLRIYRERELGPMTP